MFLSCHWLLGGTAEWSSRTWKDNTCSHCCTARWLQCHRDECQVKTVWKFNAMLLFALEFLSASFTVYCWYLATFCNWHRVEIYACYSNFLISCVCHSHRNLSSSHSCHFVQIPFQFIIILATVTICYFLSRVSILLLTCDIDIAILSVCLSVRPSVRDTLVLYENGLTYRHSFSTIR